MKTFFVLVLIVFVDGAPVAGRVGGPYPNASICEIKRAEAETRAKEVRKEEPSSEAVLKCLEMTYKPEPPPAPPKRGGNA